MKDENVEPSPKGSKLLNNPILNRSSAFRLEERKRLGLEGLLPAGVSDQATQAQRAYGNLCTLEEPLAKYRELTALQDRNEYLFYRVLLDHLAEFLPIIYTPTVGEAAQKFSDGFQRGRGIWVTPDHKGRMRDVLASALEGREVRLLVVTDNESILGLGDQGAGGMTISIGKLALYTACAGIAPECTLPISLDFGTNNQALLDNPSYLGWPAKRVEGPKYDTLVEEFVEAIESLYPKALVQWEDFRKDNALAILDRYRDRVLSFNDDIQGTGAVTLAGIFSALRVAGQSLLDQRFVVYGAGAAGLGIARQIKAALRMGSIPEEQLERRIAVLDSRGLLVADHPYSDAYKEELAWSQEWAQEIGIGEDRGLAAVVEQFKATVLVGTSGQAGSFTEPIVRSMGENSEFPVIMPLSNPTSNAEAVPSDVIEWTDGRALVATGSPFSPVTYNGKTKKIGQGNNVFIFPALGKAALICGASKVTDNMITRTAKSLAKQMLPAELEMGMLYPDVERLREVTYAVTVEVVQQAMDDGVATIQPEGDLADWVSAAMWVPDYPEL